mgnify:CR=1 FL=1
MREADDEAGALMTEGSMASELQAQLDKQKYGEDEDPQRVCGSSSSPYF